MGAAGPIIYAGSAIYSAMQQQEAGREQKKAFDFNANVAEENVGEVFRVSAEQERMTRIEGRKVIGSMRAEFGGSGAYGGTTNDVLAESAANLEADVQNIRMGAENKAKNLRAEVEGLRRQGVSAKRAADIGAVTSLLSAGSTAYGMKGK